jgi:hypothetical protein
MRNLSIQATKQIIEVNHRGIIRIRNKIAANQVSMPLPHPPITIQRVSFSPSQITRLFLLRSSDHGRRRNIASRGGAGLAGNDFLLNLDQGAAGAAGGEQDIGDEIALDVIGLTGFETLEELEAGRWN